MARSNPRAAAQRATAKRVREARQRGGRYRPVSPSAARKAVARSQVEYATAVANGDEPMPAPGTPEARQLARMGSLSRWHKADPRFYDMFKQYFYHDEKKKRERVDDEVE